MIRCVLLVLLLVEPTRAEPPTLTVKRTATEFPKATPEALRKALNNEALTVSDGKGLLAHVWLPKELSSEATNAQLNTGVTLRHLTPGTFLGVMQLARGWVDYHQQEIDAGVYTLRLAIQPNTKDHEGTAPHRDFAILSPVAKDTKLEPLPIKTLISQSGSITGGTHPVVLMLHPHAKPDEQARIARRGKAGQALFTRVPIHRTKETYFLGLGLNLLGTGIDE